MHSLDWQPGRHARDALPHMPEQVQFGIVGGGYWTERYLMVCRELPERFRISGMVVCAPFHPHPSPHGAATR